MNKVVFLGFLALVGAFFFLNADNLSPSREQTSTPNELEQPLDEPEANNTAGNTNTSVTQTSATFVPHWSSFSGLAQADEETLYYFGVVPTVDGMDTEEPGYQKLDAFVSAAGNKDIFLTLRMVESQTNAEILSTAASWQKIANETKTLVNQYGFDGVVLDLEVGLAGGLTTVPKDITDFTAFLSDELEDTGVTFLKTIYGDTVYRKRPYDLKALNPHVDGFVIMAYDFHKSYGQPGPNFPFTNREEYGYDFQKMLEDVLVQVPAEKLTITYGMFGYEWIVDNKDRPLKAATAMSLNEIDAFIEECTNCSVTIDPASGERKISYPVETGAGETEKIAVIWSETKESIRKKQEFAEEKGVGSSAFWAWGYY